MLGGATSFTARQFDDIVECPICLDVFDDPRLLPCGHTYCLRCLDQLGNSRRRRQLPPDANCDNVVDDDGVGLSCPLCGKQMDLPHSASDISGYCRGLPKNFSVQKLILLMNQSTDGGIRQRRKGESCDACSASGSSKPGGSAQEAAAFYCTDCSRKLCNACCAVHRIDMLTVRHRIVPLRRRTAFGVTRFRSEGRGGSGNTKAASLNTTTTAIDLLPATAECSVHGGSPGAGASAAIQLYCQDCHAAMCILCYIDGGHSNHKCLHVKDAVGRLRSQVVTDIDALSAAATSCRQAVDALDADRARFVADAERAGERIRNRADELRRAIDRAAAELCRRVDAARHSKLECADVAKLTIQDRLAAIETLRKDAQAVVQNGIASEIVKRGDGIHEEAGRRVSAGLEASEKELETTRSIRVSFTESNVHDFDAEMFIGDVEVTGIYDGMRYMHCCLLFLYNIAQLSINAKLLQ